MHRSPAWLAALTVLLVATGCGGAPDNDFLAPIADAAPDVPIQVPPPIMEAGPDTQTPQPLAFLSAAGVDFGLVDCGGAAPGNKAITIRNLGLAPLTWTAAMSASDVFAVIDPASGTIVPGSSATVTVSAKAVASGSLAGASVQSLLTIATNDAMHAKSDLPVRLTPGGGTLILTPTTAAFGTVPLNAQAPDLALTLTNAGNRPVSVAFAQPPNAQFGLQWTTSPSAVTLQPGASVPGLGARFRPTASLVASTTASISATGVLCGETPIIKMTGEGIVGTASVSPGDLFFGGVDCNTTAPSKTVRISNSGVGSFQFTAALTQGAASAYTIAPVSGAVNASSFIDITVTPKKVPASSLTTNDLYADTLTISTVGIPGDPPRTVFLHETARGARLSVSQPALSFGDVTIQQNKAAPFALTNTGNAAVGITLATTAPFTVAPSVPTQVDPGGLPVAATATFAPLAIGNATGTVTISAASGSVLCSDLPPPITMDGQGTNGVVSVSAAALDFLQVNCGGSATAQTFTITNDGTASFTWTAALGRGASSPYAFAPLSGGTLLPTQSATVTVTPAAIPATSLTTAGLYNDVLTVSTSVVGHTGTQVQLRETARGSILSFVTTPPNAIAFGNLPVTQTLDRPFQLVDSGNAQSSVTFVSNNPRFVVSPATATGIDNASPINGMVTFVPGTDTSPQSAVMSVTTSSVMCGPLPTLPLTGRGTNGILFVAPNPLVFGLVDCGTTASAHPFRIRNDGNGAFDWSLGLQSGNGFYTVLPSSGTNLAPAAFVDVSVVSSPIPATSAITPNLYGDTLNVTTTINGAGNTRAVPVTQTAKGVILAASVAQIDFMNVSVLGPFGSSSFLLTNNGNVTGLISPTTTNARFNTSPASTSLAGGGGAFTFSAGFTPTAPGAQSGVINFGVTGAAVCGPVAQISLSGNGTP